MPSAGNVFRCMSRSVVIVISDFVQATCVEIFFFFCGFVSLCLFIFSIMNIIGVSFSFFVSLYLFIFCYEYYWCFFFSF